MKNATNREERLKSKLEQIDDDCLDGVEFLRRHVYKVSKDAWRRGPGARLPLVTISSQRKGVRRADWRRDILEQTSAPREAS